MNLRLVPTISHNLVQIGDYRYEVLLNGAKPHMVQREFTEFQQRTAPLKMASREEGRLHGFLLICLLAIICSSQLA